MEQLKKTTAIEGKRHYGFPTISTRVQFLGVRIFQRRNWRGRRIIMGLCSSFKNVPTAGAHNFTLM